MAEPRTEFLVTDPRGRVSLGHASRTYKRSELPDGTIVLEPAALVSNLERRVLANAELAAYLRLAREHPERDVARPPRRRR